MKGGRRMIGTPDFTLVQLRYFVAAADLGSMTAAAQQLIVAQSAISSAVSTLERSLGLQLFIRHHARGLTLTSDGDRFLTDARNLLIQAGELSASAHRLGHSLTGAISIGCFTTLAPFHLPRLLSDLAAAHPLLTVDLIEGENETLHAALRSGRCEFALMYDLELGEDLATELLALAPPYAILPPGHRLAGEQGGVRLRDLARDPMIVLDLPYSRDYFQALVRASGVDPQVHYRTANYETVRALVARGHGFAILNQQPAAQSTYDGGSVATVPLLDKVPPLPVVLARLRDLRVTVRGEAFADRCRAVFRTANTTAAADS